MNISSHSNNQDKMFCVSCLKRDGLNNIFIITHKEHPLDTIFYLCTTIQLDRNESESKLLCNECVIFLKSFYDFRTRALDSYNNLLSIEIKTYQINVVMNENDNESTDLMKNEASSDDNNEDCEDLFFERKTEHGEADNSKSITKLNKQLKSENKWQCGYCNIIFSTLNPQEIRRHKYMEKQNRIRVHECKVCGKKFDTYRLRRHMFSHSVEKSVNCEVCGKGLSTEYHLKKHMMLHNGKPHACNICKKSFTENFLLKVHMSTHEKTEGYICSTCGKTFLTSVNLSTHVSKHAHEKDSQNNNTAKNNSYTCEVCGKILLSKINLEIHIANHNETKIYSCPHCERKYSHQQQLKMHIGQHVVQYRCKTCHNIYKKIDLSNHNCLPDGHKPFEDFLPNECKTCGKILANSDNLKKHEDQHNCRTCPYCNELVPSARGFRFHLNSHKLRCTLCDKGFSKKVSLELHIENQVCIKRKK